MTTSTDVTGPQDAVPAPADRVPPIDAATTAALFTTIDEALSRRDGREAQTALSAAVSQMSDNAGLLACVERAVALAALSAMEHEQAQALLARVVERSRSVNAGAIVERRVLEARARLHDGAGHAEAALSMYAAYRRLVDEPGEQATVLERMGDLARQLGQPQQAIIHYQAAFRTDRGRASATRKAMAVYLELGREEQAKQLVDLLVDQLAGDPSQAPVLADEYLRVAEALLVRPQSHRQLRDALDRADRLVPGLPRVAALRRELDAFPTAWKDHVRRLRDSALDARDKKDAARRYLSIAQIHAAYAPRDPQVEQNVDKCLLLAPGFRPALKFLETLYREQGRLNELIDRLKKLAETVRAADVAVDLWLFVAVLLAERGATPDELADAYERVRRIDPRNVAAIHALTELHLEQGRYDRAAVVLESFVQETSDVEARKQTLRQLARMYELELRQLDRAAARLEQLRSLGETEDEQILAQLADLYEKLGDGARLADVLEARARVERRRGDVATEASVLDRLFRACQGANPSPEKAFAAGRRLLALQPRGLLEEDLANLADQLGRAGEFGHTLVEAAARAVGPGEARRMRLRAAEIFLGTGDRVRARSLLDQLLDRDPRDPAATALVDAMLARDANPEEHAAILEGRLRIFTEPHERARTHVALGEVYLRQRRFDDAIAQFRAALDADAGDRNALEKLEQVLRPLERWAELASCLERRAHVESDVGDLPSARSARLRLARILDEKLDRGEDAAALLRRLHEELIPIAGPEDPQRLEVLRGLERLLERGVSLPAIAATLQPYYGSVESWRRYVEMGLLRRDAERSAPDRAAIGRDVVAVLAERLRLPREAFDVACQVMLDEPQSTADLAELSRLAEACNGWARLAEVLGEAANGLPDGPHRSTLLARRAYLLQGVLGDQVAAIAAHEAILETQPNHLDSLLALADLHEQRGEWPAMRRVLETLVRASPPEHGATLGARLGLLIRRRFDATEARPWLERALRADPPLPAGARTEVLLELADVLRGSVYPSGPREDAAALVEVLSAVAHESTGATRAGIRAEMGDLLRVHLAQHRDALAAYEAALANEPANPRALEGIHQLLDDARVPTADRQSAGTALLRLIEASPDQPVEAHVLQVLYGIEATVATRRSLIARWAALLIEDLDQAEPAFSALLTHLEHDAGDDVARQRVEAVAGALGRMDDVYDLYKRLRSSADSRVARAYAERLIALAFERNDIDGAIESLRFVARTDPENPASYERLLVLFDRKNDAVGAAWALEQLARIASGADKLQRLVTLADYAFDVLEDSERGLEALRSAHGIAADDDGVLFRLEARLRVHRPDSAELMAVLERRAYLQGQASARAALLCDHAIVALRLGNDRRAVGSLLESLRAERDGQTTPRVTDLLQRVAAGDGDAALAALDAIIEHHREQKAWQPLVDSLEIAAQKRPAGPERARLFDEISLLNAEALRVPQLAFMATCRALRDVPTDERLRRARILAEETGSWGDLLALCEDVAESVAGHTGGRDVALTFLVEAASIARRLGDGAAAVRVAESTLRIDPGHRASLGVLEAIHRATADQARLVEVLRRQVEVAPDDVVRRQALLEMARLLAVHDDAGAEDALARILTEAPDDAEALAMLDEVYERTGNSAAHTVVLERRVTGASMPGERALLRTRLALLRLRRRGDPAGAYDELIAAATDDVSLPAVRLAFEALLDHARSRGAPPVGAVARSLEAVLRAQGDLAAVVPVIELRVHSETDHEARAALLLESAQLQESLGQPALGFMAACRAVKEAPDDASLRAEAERLAEATDNLEALSLVYEDVLDVVKLPATRILLHKRIAQLAEMVGGDLETAQERLVAAVQAGANDVETLKELARLTRARGDASDLSSVLLRLAEAAVLEVDAETAKEAYAELADVDENLGDLDGAIRALRELLVVDPLDRASRATLERLLTRAERWLDLVAFLEDGATRAAGPEDAATHLARAAHVQLERLRDVGAALDVLRRLGAVMPTSEAILALGARGLMLLAGDARPDARQLRAEFAAIVEPRYESQGAWAELAPVLRLRLDVEKSFEERKRLLLRIIDIEERLLNKPELAMVTLARALGEDPVDGSLRERAERLSVRLRDLEGLLGIYEDLLFRMGVNEPLRVLYATRCGELYEGSVGDPARASDMYETALQAAAAQGVPAADQLKVLERLERLYRVVGDPQRLASTLKRRASLGAEQDPAGARQQLFEAATIELHGLQEYSAAVTTLTSLLALSPRDLPALRALAEACEKQGRWSELAQTLERELLAIGNSDLERALKTRFRLAVVLDTYLESADEALAHVHAILEVRPGHRETREYLEQRLGSRETGRFDGASFLEQSYEKTGDWQKAVNVLQAQVPDLERRGDKNELRVHLTRIADLQESRLNAPDMAFVTLCRALKSDPTDAEVRQRLKALAAQLENVDDLCEVFEDEAAVAEVSGRTTVAAELREEAAALFANALGDVARGVAAFESVLDENPGRLPSLEALSALYPLVGRWTDLEKVLRRRLAFRDEPAERIPLLLELASVVSDRLHRPDEAIPLLEQVRKHEPENVPARRQLIALIDSAGDREYLRELLELELTASRELEDENGISVARDRLATLLANDLVDVAAAIPLWEEIRAASGSSSVDASFAALESLYSLASRHADLRRLYDDALRTEREPGRVAALTARLAEVLSNHLGGKDEAVARHLKLLELDPQNVASLDALRTLYSDLGRYDELVTLLRRMMRTTGDARRLKELRFQLALVLGGKLGKRAEAVETGRRILDIEPHTPDELQRLSEVFSACEAWEELAEVLERLATQLNGPERISWLEQIADVFEQRVGRSRLAAPAYEKILALDGLHERAYERLSNIYAENAEWTRLVQLKEERVKRTEDPRTRIQLLREIGAIFDEKQGQKPLAFLSACRAFREDYDDAELASWLDRLALETDSVEELVTLYDDALAHLTNEDRILATHLRMAELAWKHLSASADAELHFRRVLEVDADNEQALEGLAGLFESQQRWKDVVGVYERRVELAGDLSVRVDWLRRIARTLDGRARDIDGAVAAFKRITELDGTNVVAVRELADLLEREQRWPALINALRRLEELAATAEERWAIRYRTAGIWESQLENLDQAVAVYRSILDEDQGHLLALKALERLFTALGRPEELLKVFERMVQLASTTEEAVRLLGKIAATHEESFEDLQSAVVAHERILKLDQGNIAAVKNLERLLRSLGAWDLLVQAYELHISLTRDPRETVSLYLAMGEVFARELGRTDKAETAYNAALELDPSSAEAIHALGSLYERSGNWFNALEKLQQEALLQGASPEALETYYRIGKINEDMLMNQQSATIAYRAALEIEPSHLPSIRALAAIAKSRGDHTERLRWLRAEAQYAINDVARTEALTNIGLFLQDTLADLEGASAEFEKALATAYDHLPAARPLAEICFRDENWARAEQLLDIIVERLDATGDSADLCRQHYRLGYVCEKLGKDQKALKNYQRSFEIDSTYLPALEGLGPSLTRAGRWDDASKIYQSILIHHRDGLTDAEVVDYYQNLAELNHKLQQSDRAVKNLEKALELDGNHVPSLRLLSTIFEGEQRYEDAYEVMIRLVPLVTGDERVQLLVEIGRLAKSELDDPYRSIDAYEDANRQRPGDRDILSALLQLFRQSRQGPRAVEILEELVRIEPEEKARVRLNQTLGEVWRDELRNEARAVQYFNAALDLDPTFVKAFESIEALLSQSANWNALEENYIGMLKRLPQNDPRGMKAVIWRNLGDLYRFKLKNLEGATQAFKVLAKLTPDSVELLEILADLLTKNPAAIDDAIVTWQRLVQLSAEPARAARPLHELVRLYLAKQMSDRAFLSCSALKTLNDALPQEMQLLQGYAKQASPQAKRAMTDKLWDVLLVHPLARGPLAQLSTILWRSAGAALVRQPKDYGLEKKKVWEKEDLDAPVPKYFVTQLKYVRGVLNVGAFELWNKLDGAEALAPLALETPTLAIGAAHPLLRDTNARTMWFQIARQLTGIRPAFVLPRALGVQRFNAVVDVAMRLVEPRYPISSDPREVAEVERLLARIAAPLANALQPVVAELLKTRQPLPVKTFLEGIELTSLRAGYLLTADLDLAIAMARQPDTGVPVSFAAKMRELALFSVSEEHFELRQRLGSALP
jgi:tetratricopeptide (TPR) repeat protein